MCFWLVERNGAVGGGDNGDGGGGCFVESIHLVANLPRHALIINLLQAGAVDVPARRVPAPLSSISPVARRLNIELYYCVHYNHFGKKKIVHLWLEDTCSGGKLKVDR